MIFFTWLLEPFNHIQLVQQFMHRHILKKAVVAHCFLDVGKIDKGDELHKEFAVEVFLRGDGSATEIKPFLQIVESFFD